MNFCIKETAIGNHVQNVLPTTYNVASWDASSAAVSITAICAVGAVNTLINANYEWVSSVTA